MATASKKTAAKATASTFFKKSAAPKTGIQAVAAEIMAKAKKLADNAGVASAPLLSTQK